MIRRHALAPTWLVLLALALAAGCQKKEGPQSSADDARGPEPATVKISEVQLGRRVNSAHQVEQPTDQFAPGDTIWASVKTEKTPAQTTLLARWVYTEGGQEQVIGEDNHTTAQAGTGYTSFFATNANPWPAGSYELRVGIGGKIQETKKFSIKG